MQKEKVTPAIGNLPKRAAVLLLLAMLAGCPDSVEPPKMPPGPEPPDAPRVPKPRVTTLATSALQAEPGNTALTVVPQSGRDVTLNCPP